MGWWGWGWGSLGTDHYFYQGLLFLGLEDNFFGRVMRFKQFFSLHFVMETIFLQPFLKMLQAFFIDLI